MTIEIEGENYNIVDFLRPCKYAILVVRVMTLDGLRIAARVERKWRWWDNDLGDVPKSVIGEVNHESV